MSSYFPGLVDATLELVTFLCSRYYLRSQNELLSFSNFLYQDICLLLEAQL